MKEKKTPYRYVLLKGEGVNQHVLYTQSKIKISGHLRLAEDAYLKHEDPEGAHAEHMTIRIPKGRWVRERQVEFDPYGFLEGLDTKDGAESRPDWRHRSITEVWD